MALSQDFSKLYQSKILDNGWVLRDDVATGRQSFGMIATNTNQTLFFRSFYGSNDDLRDTMNRMFHAKLS
jgi:hypothetical protein